MYIMSSSIEDMNLSNQEGDDDFDRMCNENIQLLMDIAQLCNSKERKNVENIFLLGKVGAGKSALINTVIKALSGKYMPRAKVGKGVGASKTLTLNRYVSCGVTRENIADGRQKDLIQGVLPRLPTIFDAAGRDNINTDAIREILELQIGGFIPPGTSIEALEDLQKKFNVGVLKKELYTESKQEWKATKIVFVQSGRETVPQNLIECLYTVLKTTDPRTAQPLYTGDVFVVITKFDLVMDQHTYNCPEDKMITLEQFEQVEKDVAKLFNIEGALDDNRIRWVSYTDDTGTNNPDIDNIALKFIKRMVMPGGPPTEDIKPVITTSLTMKLEIKKWMKNWNIGVANVFFFVIALFLAVVLFKLFTAPI